MGREPAIAAAQGETLTALTLLTNSLGHKGGEIPMSCERCMLFARREKQPSGNGRHLREACEAKCVSGGRAAGHGINNHRLMEVCSLHVKGATHTHTHRPY